MASTKKNLDLASAERHGHPITPGSAEGERETIEAALRNLEFKQRPVERRRAGREMRISPRQAGNRGMKKAA